MVALVGKKNLAKVADSWDLKDLFPTSAQREEQRLARTAKCWSRFNNPVISPGARSDVAASGHQDEVCLASCSQPSFGWQSPETSPHLPYGSASLPAVSRHNKIHREGN